MAKRKNNPIHTTQKAVETFQNAQAKRLEPPAHTTLRDQDWPHWQSIISSKRREAWTETDLGHAANLARCLADIQNLQLEITATGDIVEGRVNPRHKLVETLSRRAMALTRMLHLHAAATQGRSSDQVKRNRTAANAGSCGETLCNDHGGGMRYLPDLTYRRPPWLSLTDLISF